MMRGALIIPKITITITVIVTTTTTTTTTTTITNMTTHLAAPPPGLSAALRVDVLQVGGSQR